MCSCTPPLPSSRKRLTYRRLGWGSEKKIKDLNAECKAKLAAKDRRGAAMKLKQRVRCLRPFPPFPVQVF
eukprot:SAG11_NODE_4115_length_2059_cov_2.811735_4_plen_70_part_00